MLRPPPRTRPGVAFDTARRRFVMFGGTGISGGNLGDTWEWDGQRWTNRTPDDPNTDPSFRYSPRMAYNSVRQEAILFGGSNGLFEPLGDTWAWDGSTWRNVTPAAPGDSPAPRSGHAMTYDSRRGRVILFGGDTAVFSGNPVADTWEWDGQRWLEVTPALASDSPSPRTGHMLSYDSARGVVVLHGTFSLGPQDTWEWDGTRWTEVAPSGGNIETSADGFIFDPVQTTSLLFNSAMETWAFDGDRWRDQSGLAVGDGPPTAFNGRVLAFDEARQTTVMYDPGQRQEVWERQGRGWVELEIANTASSPFYFSSSGVAVVYDSFRRRIVTAGRSLGNAMAVWEWNGSVWSERVASTPTALQNTSGHAMAYDNSRRRTVLFGGNSGDTTFEWTGSSWLTRTLPSGSPTPPGRNDHAMVYDPIRRRTVMFGGQGTNVQARTWEWDGVQWRDESPTDRSRVPVVRYDHAMSFDTERERVLLYGGRDGTAIVGERLDDLWSWDGTRWTEITPNDDQTRPQPRDTHGLTYDTARSRTVLFGGDTTSGQLTVALDDTWELAPPTRSSAQIAFQLPVEAAENIEGLQVRAFCGARSGNGAPGAELVAWESGTRIGTAAGEWTQLSVNDSGLPLAVGDGLIAYPSGGGTAPAAEARGLVFSGNRMFFQCRPIGGSESGFAAVGVDYIEARVKYSTATLAKPPQAIEATID